MLGDPRDAFAYRIAIASLGLALVVTLAGIAWVCAEHWCVRNVPSELWFAAAAVGGVFVGTMLPFTPKLTTYSSRKEAWVSACDWVSVVVGVLVLAAFALAFWRACENPELGQHRDSVVHHHSLALYALATALGGVLLGLPIPSPGRR